MPIFRTYTPIGFADTYIGKIYLYPLLASDLDIFNLSFAKAPLERFKDLLSHISSLSDNIEYNAKNEKLSFSKIKKLSPEDIEQLAEKYITSYQFQNINLPMEKKESATTYVVRCIEKYHQDIQDRIKENERLFAKMRKKALGLPEALDTCDIPLPGKYSQVRETSKQNDTAPNYLERNMIYEPNEIPNIMQPFNSYHPIATTIEQSLSILKDLATIATNINQDFNMKMQSLFEQFKKAAEDSGKKSTKHIVYTLSGAILCMFITLAHQVYQGYSDQEWQSSILSTLNEINNQSILLEENKRYKQYISDLLAELYLAKDTSLSSIDLTLKSRGSSRDPFRGNHTP